ncbi:glycosyltransferase family 2 protein [Microseira sp. BLCC-F43]|jgi:glycosyltransferase involved in cell wall biosynthesis|uniref:glycosyltransferase family 2 protein n=1 Tax=Microseira sp. BLCC-F43 TaxID=3153602 RepID=UPI0035B7B167
MKLVSVIIPVYSVEAYIAATVQSVLDQTYDYFELLIVDDGSPDKSREICEQFTDARIKIISQENQGVAAARNSGIRQAKGEFLAFLDGDDLWLPEKLQKHIEHLENSPNVGISFSRYGFIDAAGNFLGIFKISQIEGVTPALILCRNPVGNPSCTVIRREVFEQIKFPKNIDSQAEKYCYFDEELHHFEDVELWLRIAIKTDWKIQGISEALTLYRVNPKGASTNLSKQLDGLSKMLEKTSSYAPDLIEPYGKVTKAYTLRKFAQLSVRLRDATTAKKMVHKALSTHWQIIVEEPLRTLLILAATYCLYLLPRSLYYKVETLALNTTGAIQRLVLSQVKKRSG